MKLTEVGLNFVTVTLFDNAGDPVAGAEIALAGPEGTIVSPGGSLSTDVRGAATFTVDLADAFVPSGSTVQLTAHSADASRTATFAIVEAPVRISILTPSPRLRSVGANVITVKTESPDGLPAIGIPVKVVGPRMSDVTPDEVATDDSGITVFSLSLKNMGVSWGDEVVVRAVAEQSQVRQTYAVMGANVLAPDADDRLVCKDWAFPSPVVDICEAVDGGAFSIAVLADGTVWTRGNNDHGQLGDGTVVAREEWRSVDGIELGHRVAAGRSSSYVLLRDGTVMSWGSDEFGQLGSGRGAPHRPRPAPVPGLQNVAQVVAGSGSVYVRLSAGAVMAWGLNFFGQLGNGSRTDSAVPVAVAGLTTGVTHLAAGRNTAYALVAGAVLGWGSGRYGALGEAEPKKVLRGFSPYPTFWEWWIDGLIPQRVPQLPDDIIDIAAGHHAGWALTSDGHVWSWGEFQQWGWRRAPHTLSDCEPMMRLSAHETRAYGMQRDGTTYSLSRTTCSKVDLATAESNGFAGREIDRLRAPYLLASHVRSDAPRMDVLTDHVPACGTVEIHAAIDTRSRPDLHDEPVVFLLTDIRGARLAPPATVWPTGGGRVTATFDLPDDWRPPGERLRLFLFLGDFQSCADLIVLSANVMEIVAAPEPEGLKLVPSELVFPSPVTSIVSSGAGDARFDIALLADGSVWARGSNACGQLGDGTTVRREGWAPVGLMSRGVTQIAATLNTVYALRDDKTLWVWGSARYLGKHRAVSDDPSITSPQQLQIFRNRVRKIVGGAETSFVLTEDAEFGGDNVVLRAWGRNDRGQTGTGSEEDVVWPPLEVYMSTEPWDAPFWLQAYEHIVAGAATSYAAMSTDHFFAWGANDRGQIGDGTTIDRREPVKIRVRQVHEAIQISASGATVYAISAFGGNLYGWGDNGHGQFGEPPNAARIQLQPRGLFHSLGNRAVGSILDFVFAQTAATNSIVWSGRPRGFDTSDPDRRPGYLPSYLSLPDNREVTGFGTTSGIADGSFVFFSRGRPAS